jgi:hypothetical protein
VTPNGHRGPRAIRTATLSGAAAAVGVALHSRLIVTLNGEASCHDAGTGYRRRPVKVARTDQMSLHG